MSFWSVLIASLLGSLHCVGMCGGLIAFFSGRSESKVAAHVSYHLGRLMTYCLLGLAAGFIGGQFNRAGELIGFQQLTAVVTGVLLIYWGLRELLGKRRGSAAARPTTFSFRMLSQIFRLPLLGSLGQSWTARAGLLGACSTFLPCGWLYSFVAIAAASADPLSGLTVMTAFWCGTVPLLVGVGAVVRALSTNLQRQLPRITAALLIFAGCYSLYGRYEELFQPEAPPAGMHCHEKGG